MFQLPEMRKQVKITVSTTGKGQWKTGQRWLYLDNVTRNQASVIFKRRTRMLNVKTITEIGLGTKHVEHIKPRLKPETYSGGMWKPAPGQHNTRNQSAHLPRGHTAPKMWSTKHNRYNGNTGINGSISSWQS